MAPARATSTGHAGPVLVAPLGQGPRFCAPQGRLGLISLGAHFWISQGPLVSEYGIAFPTDRVEPVLSGNSIADNKKEAVEWITAWKARAGKEKKVTLF